MADLQFKIFILLALTSFQTEKFVIRNSVVEGSIILVCLSVFFFFVLLAYAGVWIC